MLFVVSQSKGHTLTSLPHKMQVDKIILLLYKFNGHGLAVQLIQYVLNRIHLATQ